MDASGSGSRGIHLQGAELLSACSWAPGACFWNQNAQTLFISPQTAVQGHTLLRLAKIPWNRSVSSRAGLGPKNLKQLSTFIKHEDLRVLRSSTQWPVFRLWRRGGLGSRGPRVPAGDGWAGACRGYSDSGAPPVCAADRRCCFLVPLGSCLRCSPGLPG